MINCALVGVGYWGTKLQKYIEENPNFNLKYVCDSKSNLNEIWDDDEVTAVVVAVPNEARYSIVKSALLHDKDVFSEKPLALTTWECNELKQLANNSKLVTDYTWTFSKGLRIAQDRIGEIGKILGIEMAIRHLGRFGGGNVYWLLGSHMLSVLDMFTPIKNLAFEKTDLVVYNKVVETGIISFKGEGLKGQIVISLNYPGKETKVIIYGEDGTIIYDPLSHLSLQIITYERLKWTIELPQEREELYADEENNLRYAIEYFYNVLIGKADNNIERAVEITKILEKLETSKVLFF